MTIEQKVKKPYIKRFAVWLAIVAALSTVAYFYHRSPNARFEPVVTVSLLIFIVIGIFWGLGIQKYLFDKSFSGVVTNVKASSKLEMPSALERKIIVRTVVEMTVECDDGRSILHEERLPPHMAKKIPYRAGDRVYHIKGAKHTCRFPRNDTKKTYERRTVICPLCGAVMPLGNKECSFCNNELPYDPAVK